MSRPTGWWWVRHAPVPGTEERRNGQRDVDCDTSDERSFRALAAILPGDAISVVSPLKRTRQTLAAINAAGAGLPELIGLACEPAARPMMEYDPTS